MYKKLLFTIECYINIYYIFGVEQFVVEFFRKNKNKKEKYLICSFIYQGETIKLTNESHQTKII